MGDNKTESNMRKPIFDPRHIVIEAISDEIVKIRKRMDHLKSELGDERINICNDDISDIMVEMIPIFTLAYQFNVLPQVSKRADTIYEMQTNIIDIIMSMSRYTISMKGLFDSSIYVDLDNCADEYSRNGTFDNNPIIQPFADLIAGIQKHADEIFYKDDPPKYNTNEASTNILSSILPIRRITDKIGITNIVYDAAYKIYDFRNSGCAGYALKGGQIVKIE